MAVPIQISRTAARRLILGRQGLWPGRRLAGKAGTRQAMRALEHLQLDPLVIVARSHDLVLHARVEGYRPEFFHQLTYEEREFFDWGGWLAVRPMEELPYWRVVMRRNANYRSLLAILQAHGPAIDAMRALLNEGGTVANRDLRGGTHTAVQGHYRGGNSGSLALYYLWRVGEAMTHHRDGFERVYAATESVAPAHLRGEASDAEADLFLARKAIAAAGIGRLGPLSSLLDRKVPADEERAIEQALVDAGEIVPVEVEGMRGRNFILGEDVETVAELEQGLIPAAWRLPAAAPGNELSLLSPLDPVVDRVRAKALFDFDYVWEIYKRAEQVRFGRYVMPILWGDRLVGRVDPKTDRKAGALVVNGLWLEESDMAGDPEFVEALGRAFARLAELVGVARIDAGAVAPAALRAAIERL